MLVTQTDYQTIRIEKNGLSFYLSYSLIWNGEERWPESITLRENSVTAYFLTSTIRDTILPTVYGVAVKRIWAFVPAGELSLGFRLDFPGLSAAPCLFPGRTAAGNETPQVTGPVAGELTVYHCALFIYSHPSSALIFIDPPKNPEQAGSVEIERRCGGEESFLGAFIRFPGGPEKVSERKVFHTEGNFEYAQRLNLVISRTEEIHRQAISSVLNRLRQLPHSLENLTDRDPEPLIREGIDRCLSELLISKGGIFALRREALSPELSSSAGLLLALLLFRLPTGPGLKDPERVETALRLADFSLKGQHPSGVFFETFSLEKGTWIGSSPREAPSYSPSLSIEDSARIAGFILELSLSLEELGLPSAKYRAAAQRMIESCFDEQKKLAVMGSEILLDSLGSVRQGYGELALIPALTQLLTENGRDYYRKGLRELRDRHLAQAPPFFPPAADSHSALLRLSSVLHLLRAGIRLKEPASYLNPLLPWIYLNHRPGKAAFSEAGGLLESFSSYRLLFRGCELAYTLLEFDRLLPGVAGGWLENLARQVIGFSLRKPLGTAYLGLDRDRAESFRPGTFGREALYLLKIRDEFPCLF